MRSLYDLEATSLEGTKVDLSTYRGKVALVVNVASACGYTPQYAGLEALQQAYAARGLVVLGFPSNEFGGQEPGSAEEIRAFCSSRYHVSFPLFAKGETRPGPGQSAVYRFLTAGGQVPAWNFSKYLVDATGHVVGFFASGIAPDSPELRSAIEAALQTTGSLKS